MVLVCFQHPLGRLNQLNVLMLESKFSAFDAAWQSTAVPRLCCPLLSHVPDETVSLNVAKVPVEHDTSHTLCPMAVVVLPAGQSVQLVCPVELLYLPAAHDLHAASLVCPGPASENLPAWHSLHTAGDVELSTKDPAGQFDAAVQFAKQRHGYPLAPHEMPLRELK